MDDKVPLALVGIAGALIGSFATFCFNWLLNRRKSRDDARLRMACDILGFLGRATNREAPDQHKGEVARLRQEWAQHARTLYLLRVKEKSRRAVDDAMVSYFDALEEYDTKPARRPEVDRRRNLAIEQGYRLMRAVGLS